MSSSYTGRPIARTASAASSSRVEHAALIRKQNTLEGKVAQVRAYMLGLAHQYGSVHRVPCPSPAEWERLASGRNPVLPHLTILHLYADGDMRSRVAAGESYYEVYWQAALAQQG